MKPVKPFKYEFCKGCMLNGCYPWAQNVFLKCSTVGGFFPAIIFEGDNGSMVCQSFKEVTEDVWFAHFKDKRKEAEDYEETRFKAMTCEINSNQKELW